MKRLQAAAVSLNQGEKISDYNMMILCKVFVCVHMFAGSVYVRWALYGCNLIKEGFEVINLCFEW